MKTEKVKYSKAIIDEDIELLENCSKAINRVLHDLKEV